MKAASTSVDEYHYAYLHATFAMPQDPDLYGRQPSKKKKTGELDLSNTLGFAAQLQSIISSKSASSSSSSSTKKRPRQDDAQAAPKAKTAKGVNGKRGEKGTASFKKSSHDAPLDDRERERIRTSMAAKARRYAAMQRGDYQAKDGEAASLVDFDRKWAEKVDRGDESDSKGATSDSDTNTSNDYSGSDFERDRTTMVEFVDEFGRTRNVSKAERDRALRRQARAQRAAQDLDAMSALPAAPADPSRIIYGNTIQTAAIETVQDRMGTAGTTLSQPDASAADADTHYRASDDVRTRGAAFYAFATDDETARAAQMKALADERAKTEAARAAKEQTRAERSVQLEARRREMAARRAVLEEKKAKRQADSFLEGLGDLL